MFEKKICFLLFFGVLTGCSQTVAPHKAFPHQKEVTLRELERAGPQSIDRLPVSTMRMQQLHDTALRVGAQGGLAKRAKEINRVLLCQDKLLDRVFNFNLMLLDDNVLPPVLLAGHDPFTLHGHDSIRLADREYQILKQAKFVTAAPTWRDYLWMPYEAPEIPHHTLLPQSNSERLVWKQYLREGWEAGLLQADLIFKENLSKLSRDFGGMIRYRVLLEKKMVSAPFVAQVDLGITGGSNHMTINDKLLRITAFPSLLPEGDYWEAQAVPQENTCVTPDCLPRIAYE